MIGTVLKLVLTVCLIWSCSAHAVEMTIGRDFLPDLRLTVPQEEDDRDYLGLSGAAGSVFSLADVKADVLLIELLSLYCPYCQQEAPNVNELYQRMEEISEQGVVVKIIGIGVANSQLEVEQFRDTYEIPFPLFPDADKAMFKALSGVGAPSFIGCRLDGKKGQPVIVLRKGGGFYNAENFLKELLKKSGFQNP